MPICIECCYAVSQLYHVLHSRKQKTAMPISKPSVANLAGFTISPTATSHAQNATGSQFKTKNASGGGDVRLTQCPRCKRFADKYIEHDFVVLFIDLVLVKPQVSDLGEITARSIAFRYIAPNRDVQTVASNIS